MSIPDIYTITLLSNTFKNFELTHNSFYDTIIIGVITFLYLFCDTNKLKSSIKYYSNYIFDGNYNKYKVVAQKGKVPIAFKAIVWYISNNKNDSIKYVELLFVVDKYKIRHRHHLQVILNVNISSYILNISVYCPYLIYNIFY